MNDQERVFLALERKQPDRVPILEWSINAVVVRSICNRNCSFDEFVETMGLSAVVTGEMLNIEKGRGYKIIDERKNIVQDDWGVVRRFTTEVESYPIESPIKTERDLERYVPPDPMAEYRLGNLPDLVKWFKGRKAVIWCASDVFDIPCALRGVENLLTDFLLNPRLAKRLIKMSADYNMKLIKRAIDAEAEIIMLGDDYAWKRGPLMSPGQFKEFILPDLGRMVHFIKESGAYCIKHTDGNIWDIMDMLIDTGIDAVNPLEPVAGMDIGEVKKRYGTRVCLIGNIDCGHTLSQASIKEVVEEVKKCISQAAPNGGYIMSSSNSIHSSVKPENYIAMIEATKEYGKYPLVVPISQ